MKNNSHYCSRINPVNSDESQIICFLHLKKVTDNVIPFFLYSSIALSNY